MADIGQAVMNYGHERIRWVLAARLWRADDLPMVTIRRLTTPLGSPARASPTILCAKSVPSNSVDYYVRTAEEYYNKLPRPDAQLHKPFSSLIEASNALAKLGPLLEGLQLGKKMTVLDFGAGTCWLSRFLALLDCRPICLDVSETALQLGQRLFREWPSLDEPIEQPRFLLFDGRTICLPDNSVDRIACFESLHHVPNMQEVLAEMYRVLTPGGIAGFVEPGEHHSEHPFSQAEMLNYDVLELDIVVSDIWKAAQTIGFSDIRFSMFSFPSLNLSIRDRNTLTKGHVPRSISQHIMRSMTSWSIFFLHKGDPVLDSRGVSGLGGEIRILSAPPSVPSGHPFEVQLRCVNIGQATWLGPDAYQNVGSVRVGPHLYEAGSMRLIDFEVPRHALAGPVPPGESRDETVKIGPLPAGDYVLTFDLVSEFVTWFESLGTIPPQVRVSVG